MSNTPEPLPQIRISPVRYSRVSRRRRALPTRAIVWLSLLACVVGLIAIGVITRQHQDPVMDDAKLAAEKAVKLRLKYPDEAEFLETRAAHMTEGDIYVVGLVRSPNAFGMRMTYHFSVVVTLPLYRVKSVSLNKYVDGQVLLD
jgi:hypothetical protein